MYLESPVEVAIRASIDWPNCPTTTRPSIGPRRSGPKISCQGDGNSPPDARNIWGTSAQDSADGRGHDEFAASSLLVSCRERTLAQQIKFVLVETALQAEQQTIIALPRGIDCLLVDQHRVDDATHLDELLPVAAVAGKARDLPGRDSSDLAEADFRHHPFEAGAGDATCRRAAEIVVDRLDLAPAERDQPVAHGVLQRAALPVVQNLVGGGLADVEDRLPVQMMRPNLLRHHGAPSSVGDGDRRPRDRRSGASAAPSKPGALVLAASAIPASVPRCRRSS